MVTQQPLLVNIDIVLLSLIAAAKTAKQEHDAIPASLGNKPDGEHVSCGGSIVSLASLVPQ